MKRTARIWRGWTAADTADEYARHLRDVALPTLASMPGNLGSFVLRRRLADGVEFLSLSLWESLDAVSKPGAPAEDHRLLVGRQTVPAEWELVADALRADDASGILERIVAA